MDNEAQETGVAPFQKIIFPPDDLSRVLYFREDKIHSKSYTYIDRHEGRCFVRAGDCCSFDTYYNSFYEATFVKYTNIKRVLLRLKISGSGVIRVYRSAPSVALVLLFHQDVISQGEYFTVTIDLESFVDGSRLFFELHGVHDGIELHEGGWHVIEPKKRDVRLNVAICTFKKLPFVDRVVKKLIDSDLDHIEPWDLTIVDNGSEIQDNRYPQARVRVIRQANTGGAGGFTRGIIESQNLGYSHVLLMDDDISLDPESIRRAIRWLEYAQENLCLGGAMLDLYRPEFMTESSGSLSSASPFVFVPNCGELNLSESKNLDLISAPKNNNCDTQTGYCGWWFFAFPIEAVNKLGLPLPCFIRGDDIEYSMRLRNGGYKVFPAPGIAVLHEPFYAKPSHWIEYFIFYNALIIAARYDFWNIREIKNSFMKEIRYFLSCMNYEMAAVRIVALEDFLRGCEYFKTTPPAERLNAARNAAADFSPRKIPVEPSLSPVSPTQNKKRKLRAAYWRTKILYACDAGHRGLKLWESLGWIKSQKILRMNDINRYDAVNCSEIIAIDPWLSYHPVFTKRPEAYQELKGRSQIAIQKLEQKWPLLASEFRREFSTFTSRSYWEKYLNL